MRVTVLTSDTGHPIYPWLVSWASNFGGAAIEVVTRIEDVRGGDFLFLISCHQIVTAYVRNQYKYALVAHASDLPQGRGWSPMIWTILEGKNIFIVTLLEAADRLDSGAIWLQKKISLEGHELFDELNNLLFAAEIELMEAAIQNVDVILPRNQQGNSKQYYARRTPADSRLDPQRNIADQFDLLRVCDSNRYPAFFDYRGHRFEVRLRKVRKSD